MKPRKTAGKKRPAEPRAKAPYIPPKLTEYGKLKETTAGGSLNRRDSRGGAEPG